MPAVTPPTHTHTRVGPCLREKASVEEGALPGRAGAIVCGMEAVSTQAEADFSVSGVLRVLLGFQRRGGPGSAAEADNGEAGVSQRTEPGGLLNRGKIREQRLPGRLHDRGLPVHHR